MENQSENLPPSIIYQISYKCKCNKDNHIYLKLTMKCWHLFRVPCIRLMTKKVNKYLIIFLYFVTIYIVQQQIINNIHEAVLTLRNVFSSVYFQGEDSWS